ncbi:hypothetical protein GY45DRAFT_848108 [Cubamyces sp. BRFM 1775]|nr:hypothetical protein GY45DRAFT_848108 [Cubamyces sp. BRFM 1775]
MQLVREHTLVLTPMPCTGSNARFKSSGSHECFALAKRSRRRHMHRTGEVKAASDRHRRLAAEQRTDARSGRAITHPLFKGQQVPCLFDRLHPAVIEYSVHGCPGRWPYPTIACECALYRRTRAYIRHVRMRFSRPSSDFVDLLGRGSHARRDMQTVTPLPWQATSSSRPLTVTLAHPPDAKMLSNPVRSTHRNTRSRTETGKHAAEHASRSATKTRSLPLRPRHPIPPPAFYIRPSASREEEAGPCHSSASRRTSQRALYQSPTGQFARDFGFRLARCPHGDIVAACAVCWRRADSAWCMLRVTIDKGPGPEA